MPLLPLPLQPVGGCALLITALMANEDGTPFVQVDITTCGISLGGIRQFLTGTSVVILP